MTDQGRPLSRRERREAEARQAAQDIPTTPLPEAPPVTHPDGTPLSRKERRRIERAASPLETWTAEEEMIATGQIPVMTPEALDAQERIERDRTEVAEPDAAATVDEHADEEPGVARAASMFAAETPVEAAVEQDEPAVEPEPEPEPVADAVPEAPADDPFVFVTAESAADLEAESEDLAPEPEEEAAPSPWAWVDQAEAWQPADDAPQADAAAEAAADVDPDDVTEVLERIDGPAEDGAVDEDAEPSDADLDAEETPAEIPDAYRHLFPPGSLQARRFEGQQESAAAPEAEPEPTPATSGADEIRRLTELAMAGIAAAQARPAERDVAEVEETVADEPLVEDEDTQVLDPAEVYAEAEPGEEAPADQAPPATAEPAPVARPSLFGAGGPSLFGAVTPSTPVDDTAEDAADDSAEPEYAPEVEPEGDALPQRGDAAPALEDPEAVVAPEPEPTFEPEEEAEVEPEPVLEPEPEEEHVFAPATPATGAAITPARLRPATAGDTSTSAGPSVWDAHPLTQSTPRQVADYTPSQDIPIPDFTKIMHGYATTSSSAGTAPEGHVGDGPLGTEIPVADAEDMPRRPQPEQEEGAHHFAWAHLAVIAAVAFLLGVLVWHLTGNA